VKIVIGVTRNAVELTGGWSEEALARYLVNYVATYGVVDRMKADFPEYDFTAEVTR